jgi:catalase
VEEGLKYIGKHNVQVYEGNFGKRQFQFAWEAEPNLDNPEEVRVHVGISIHNPNDKYLQVVGTGLVGYSLKYEVDNVNFTMKRKVWRSLNSKQKMEFVENTLRNLCMAEKLVISRRAAMGGR